MTYATEQLVSAVSKHPLRWERVTRQSALSLPVLKTDAEPAELAFFWHPVGGPPQARTIGRPYQRVVARFDSLTEMDFLPFSPFGPVRPDQDPVLGSATAGGRATPDERRELTSRLHRSLDTLARRGLPGTSDATPEELAAAADYRQAFDRLALNPLRPAYQALSPDFFAWVGFGS